MEFPAGCLGKLPQHGDFIRYNAAGAEVGELDHWIQDGIYQGYNELDSQWDSTFDAAPVARFIYCSPRSRRMLAGMFKPSVDRAGRRYPFLVYSVLEAAALGAEIGYLPSALDPFLAEAQGMLDAEFGGLSAFLAGFEALRFTPDTTHARKEFGRYVLTSSARDYWAACFGNADDPRRFGVVAGAAEGSAQARPVVMRLPFSGVDSEVTFWFELARRLSDGRQLPTLTFWNQPHGEAPARLHLAWGELSARYFLPFVLPARSSLALRDFSSQTVDEQWIQQGRDRFQAVLNESTLKLTDLLQRLPRV